MSQPTLPKGWRRATIEDVVRFDTDSLIPEPAASYTYVGLEHIESETGILIGEKKIAGASIRGQKFRFTNEHVLYGKLRPYLNKVALPYFNGICSTDIIPLQPKHNVVREYLAYWLRSRGFLGYARAHATGTKMPRLGPSQFLKAAIPLPPLPVQQRIVEILQKAYSIRRKRHEALDLADLILSSAFIEMFGNPKGNPKHFEVVPLGDLADVRSGVTKGRRLRGKETVEVPYLRVANVQDGYLDLLEIKTIEVLPEDLEKYHLKDGDILMTEGGDPDKLGRGCIWRNKVEGCIHQNHVFRVRADRSCLSPQYLAALLRTQYAKEYFLRCAKRTSNLASINSTQVKAFPIPIPPITLQSQFVAAVDQWEQIHRRLTDGLAESKRLFQGVMQQAFIGELTATWEAARADEIAAEQTRRERLPRLVLLDFVRERQRRRSSEPVLITSLMKYVFLLQKEGTTGQTLYHFVPYKYGPFARELYQDLEALAAEGFIAVTESDEERTEIALVPSEETTAQEVIAELPEDLRTAVARVLEQYGSLSHNQLLASVYEKYPVYATKSRLRHRPSS